MRRVLCLAIALILGVLAVPTAWAQTASPTQATDGEDAEAGDRNIEFVGVPIPDYNEVMGWGLGAMAAAFYRINPDDLESQPSMSALAGFYAQNETWFWAVGQRLFLKEDQFRATGAFGQVNFNFQFFPGNFVPGIPGDLTIPFGTEAQFAFGEFATRTWQDLYIGVRYRWAEATTRFQIGDPDDNFPLPPEVSLPKRTFSGIGPVASYDNRDNFFNPAEGFLFEYSTLFDGTNIGSANDFETTKLELNNYFRMRDDGILATRAYFELATGDVPFEGQAIMGQGVDLRGYGKGEYRGDQLYAFQGEYRWNVYQRIGVVGFAGLGWVATDGDYSPVLPSVGAGFRFLAAQEYNVNVGVDIAKGRDDWSIRFSIGEAF